MVICSPRRVRSTEKFEKDPYPGLTSRHPHSVSLEGGKREEGAQEEALQWSSQERRARWAGMSSRDV